MPPNAPCPMSTPPQPPLNKGGSPAPCPNLLVPKQIVKLEGEPGAVTVAIAVSEVEYTGRQGKLFLVGTGPWGLRANDPGGTNCSK